MFNKGPQQDDQTQVPDQAQVPAPEVIAPPEPAPDVHEQPAAPATPPALPGLPGNLSAPAPSTDDSGAPAPATTAPPAVGSASSASSDTPAASDELLGLKQEALQQLSPLVGHLDQSPEEKFRTTMMMIQATDDSSKIKDAYEAAQQITDDKARAQALLDVVNEINYFTQQHHDNQ